MARKSLSDSQLKILAKGKKELEAYNNGKQLSPEQSILAKCHECSGFYIDGCVDCKMPECPLYPYMPFNKKKKLQQTIKNLKD